MMAKRLIFGACKQQTIAIMLLSHIASYIGMTFGIIVDSLKL